MIDSVVTVLCRIAHSRSPSQYSTAWGLSGYFGTLILGLLLLTSGCTQVPRASETSSTPTAFEAATPSTAPLLTATQQIQTKVVGLIPPSDPVTITRYRLDNSCQDFVSEPLQVSKQDPVRDAVGRILLEQDFFAFDLSAYRVTVTPGSKQANIDLRLAPDSERLLISLSSCEQLALFGSLRRTLLGNPEWDIRDVTFTNRGEAIVY
ncbi:MAG TPA: hypothetical protein V6D07_03735 [Trichocoleus sp.]